MKQQSKPLDFLKKANKDTALSVKIYKAIEKGNLVMAKEVLEIAKKAGFSFTKEEFENDVRKDIEKRFAAGDISIASAISKKVVSDAPESACSKGCLSYTTNYHPSAAVLEYLKRPVNK